ncbi:MAG: radical SAM protein [Sedimentisphaerales bacterium]
MRIILINPPARFIQHESIVLPPLGLMYIGTVLKTAGYDVEIKDAFAEGMNWENFRDYIKGKTPDVVGIGGMSPVIDNTFRAINIARSFTKYIVMGGPHVTAHGQDTFHQCPEIDFGVIGEGEEVILKLMHALSTSGSAEGIDGVITKSAPSNNKRHNIDINSLPYPDLSMVPYHLYRYPFSKNRYVTTMVTSRGCPYCCTFCDKSVFGSHWRARSAENILGEIDEMVNVYNMRSIIFYDDLFTLKKERVIELCDGILKRGYDLEWKCEGRVNLADYEVMKLMKRAGCSMIAYGAESGNQYGLDYLNKHVSLEQIKKAFELTNKAGIKTMAYFVLGIPVETYQDELRTIQFAKEIRATYAQFSILSPYYGTQVYDEAIQKGWYRESGAQNPMDGDLRRPVVLSENWDEEKLRRILRVAHWKFY